MAFIHHCNSCNTIVHNGMNVLMHSTTASFLLAKCQLTLLVSWHNDLSTNFPKSLFPTLNCGVSLKYTLTKMLLHYLSTLHPTTHSMLSVNLLQIIPLHSPQTHHYIIMCQIRKHLQSLHTAIRPNNISSFIFNVPWILSISSKTFFSLLLRGYIPVFANVSHS